MTRREQELAPLFLPGTIALPSPFPSVGDLSIEQGGAEFTGGQTRDLFVVSRRFEPSTDVCWTILVERVSAVLLTHGDRLDRRTAEWRFGPAVRDLPGEEHPPKGIVFVPEDAPVLMRIEFGMTAGESTDYPIPGWRGDGGCDPCCHHTFSYERVMGGPDEAEGES